MAFGVVVVGPPGSGKSTFCAALERLLTAAGRRCAVVDLDPSPAPRPYNAAVALRQLCGAEHVQARLGLGPNGALLYCLELLAHNQPWLQRALQPLEDAGAYVIVDTPGQAELWMHHASLRGVLHGLVQERHYRITAALLLDAHYAVDAPLFVSALVSALAAMLQLELPHVNVLSKIDAAEALGPLPLALEHYTDVLDLQQLLRYHHGRVPSRYRRLSAALAEVVEDYGLLAFHPLDVRDDDSLRAVLKSIDKANGYVYGAGDEALFAVAEQDEFQYFRCEQRSSCCVLDALS